MMHERLVCRRNHAAGSRHAAVLVDPPNNRYALQLVYEATRRELLETQVSELQELLR